MQKPLKGDKSKTCPTKAAPKNREQTPEKIISCEKVSKKRGVPSAFLMIVLFHNLLKCSFFFLISDNHFALFHKILQFLSAFQIVHSQEIDFFKMVTR